MSRTKRTFSAKFQSDLVLEVLKGENDIKPNLLRNWKQEFLLKASSVFDDKRDEKIKEKLESERKEKEAYAKKVGQLTMQVDWLKKNLQRHLDLTTKLSLLKSLSRANKKEIPISTAAELLRVNRTSIYYKGAPVSDAELYCKSVINHLHTEHPTWGARQMSSQLKQRGYKIGRKKTRRYMTEMAIDPIYPKPNLSKRRQEDAVVPYRLRKAVITRPNQAWSIDITYIPIERGFLYLTAIIDWYSRMIVGWELDDTLDTRACIQACKMAFRTAKPEILNSDRGCRFTSVEYKEFLAQNAVTQSMDGKSRWADNIMIELWFRTFKYEEAYLTRWTCLKEARRDIKHFIHDYNFERCHSSIGNVPPAQAYYPALLLKAARMAA